MAALPRGLTRDEAMAVSGRAHSLIPVFSEIVFDDPNGTGARARIDVVNPAGGITGVQVLAGGDGYGSGGHGDGAAGDWHGGGVGGYGNGQAV